MAVDYLHRLVVGGPREQVRALRRQMHREYPRTAGGKTWTEVVPFSFTALYDLAPSARRVEREIPCDPYELSVWPVRRTDDRRAEIRYQFQTRNLEMAGLLPRALESSALAHLYADDPLLRRLEYRELPAVARNGAQLDALSTSGGLPLESRPQEIRLSGRRRLRK